MVSCLSGEHPQPGMFPSGMVSPPPRRVFLPSGGFLFFLFQETGGDGLGELIRPGITAVIIKWGFTKTDLRLFVNQIPAAETAVRQFIHAGKRHAETSSPKVFQINHKPEFLVSGRRLGRTLAAITNFFSSLARLIYYNEEVANITINPPGVALICPLKRAGPHPTPFREAIL
jgi:hypothetical protein